MFVFSWIHIIIPILGLLINVVIQITSFRLIPKIGLLKSIFLGFGIGAVIVILSEIYIVFVAPLLLRDFVSILIVNMIAYSALGYCYFHFINLGETARRIRILREIYDSGDGLTEREILTKYNAKQIIDVRLSRLLNNGQVLYRNGRYYIGNPTMLFISKIIVGMKSVLLGKKSEVE